MQITNQFLKRKRQTKIKVLAGPLSLCPSQGRILLLLFLADPGVWRQPLAYLGLCQTLSRSPCLHYHPDTLPLGVCTLSLSACLSFPLLTSTTVTLDEGPTRFQNELILTNYICNDCFQIRSHSEFLGMRTPTHLFEEYNSTHGTQFGFIYTSYCFLSQFQQLTSFYEIFPQYVNYLICWYTVIHNVPI